MRRLLTVTVAAAVLLPAQKIETQTADKTKITRVETALNHLTVIEVADPVDQVAVGSSTFKVEWRGNKVFVQPLEPGAATNLFIWTQPGGRLNYELIPAGAVESMHFAIDETPQVAAAPTAAPAESSMLPPAPEPAVPAEMLQRSKPVRLAGGSPATGGVAVLLRDLYEKDGKLYLRYAIRNDGKRPYEPAAPFVAALKSPRASQSLYSMSETQLGANLAGRVRAQGLTAVRVIHSEIAEPVVAPGQQTTGIVAVELRRERDPQVLRLSFPADDSREVSAVLVL